MAGASGRARHLSPTPITERPPRQEATVNEDHTLFALRVVAALTAIVRHVTKLTRGQKRGAGER